MMERTLKVYTCGDPYQGGFLPQIRLQGKWLRKAGFAPGGRIRVVVEKGRLTISSEQEVVRGT
jgi:hypothetical protein